MSVVRDAAFLLPEPLAALLVEMAKQLTATAAAAPLAALRTTGVLERLAARVGRERSRAWIARSVVRSSSCWWRSH
ncbi:hypothetical protein NJL88_16310 [Streptomyces sp. DK15]|uniref:hypothetical protein n=1 Tax=Streptomyces sp. DK15 TaxID=2957499 RepID=UPI0029B8D450|nr:hypothetical protein [Streptomyces sp. DK15]MDX2391582.1 hypothetical protein [Streptomyces sp. DK15]